MPKAILFDLDGTLWDRTAAVRALLADQHEHFQAFLGPVIPSREYASQIMALEANGSADKFSVYVAFGHQHGLSESLIDSLHSDFWRRMGQCFQPFPEVLATLRQLRKAGVKLGIITNGTVHIQDAKINALGLRELLDVVVISEREGMRKPEAEIFNRALDSLGVVASDAWFVGDNPEVDVAGAAAAGLRSFWRECDDWPRPTAACETIRSLDELLPFVSQASHQPQ
jgi:putative hydrolase of the HAD superfamily